MPEAKSPNKRNEPKKVASGDHGGGEEEGFKSSFVIDDKKKKSDDDCSALTCHRGVGEEEEGFKSSFVVDDKKKKSDDDCSALTCRGGVGEEEEGFKSSFVVDDKKKKSEEICAALTHRKTKFTDEEEPETPSHPLDHSAGVTPSIQTINEKKQANAAMKENFTHRRKEGEFLTDNFSETERPTSPEDHPNDPINVSGAIRPGAVAVAGIGEENNLNTWESLYGYISSEGEGVPTNRESYKSNNDHSSFKEGAEDTSENLISAVVVDDTAIPKAEAVPEETLIRRRRRNLYIGFVMFIVLIVVIILSAALLSKRSSISETFPTESPSPSLVPSAPPSPSPSLVPSASPSSSPTTSIQLHLEGLSQGLAKAFTDISSPQSKALLWLEVNHTHPIENLYSIDRIVQRFVMASLYYSLDGDTWIESKHWLSTEDECNWFSSHRNGPDRCKGTDFLYDLKLNSNRLKGSIPPEIHLLRDLKVLDLSNNAINGKIPSEIGLMTSIETLKLKGNNFDGVLPTELALIHRNLFVLDLGSNALEGSLHPVLGHLTNLEQMDISDNLLAGTLFTELGKLLKLTSLILEENSLTGSICSDIQSLQELEVLKLKNNLLSGTFPYSDNDGSLQISSKLRAFDVSSNFIGGSISSTIGFMLRLELLDISNNRLESSLPLEIGRLSSAGTICLGENDLTGQIPESITKLKRLNTLDLQFNSINGTLPADIHLIESLETFNLEGNSISGTLPADINLMENLETLDLSGNNIGGLLPGNLTLLKKLKVLDLHNNDISGMLPVDIHRMENLESLVLSSNRIGGSLPQNIALLTNLKYLSIGGNNIDGTLPVNIHMMENLETLYLLDTKISGSLPGNISLLKKLKTLNLLNNNIDGTLPGDIQLMENLETIYLNFNNIGGSLPRNITFLSNLEQISLKGNKIGGTIPADIHLMENLETFNLCDNNISGLLPGNITLLTNLRTLNLGRNNIGGTLPTDIHAMKNLETLDLQSNNISGSLPSNTTLLTNLKVIDLTGNNIGGTLPVDIHLMENLEWIYMNDNKLTKGIPSELGLLKNLERLLLDGNNLTGSVPIELCDSRRNNNIDYFAIDCDKVYCDCCFDRCGISPRIPNAAEAKPCPDGNILLQVAIGTDRNPQDVEWDVAVQSSTNETLLSSGPLTERDGYKTIVEEACIPNDACAIFILHGSNDEGHDLTADNVGNRFLVHWNGEELSNGRFQDFQDLKFFYGTTESCIGTKGDWQACSVSHPTCSTGFKCRLDNIGGLSGFCRTLSPSISPSASLSLLDPSSLPEEVLPPLLPSTKPPLPIDCAISESFRFPLSPCNNGNATNRIEFTIRQENVECGSEYEVIVADNACVSPKACLILNVSNFFSSLGTLSGYHFNDTNNDCVQDSGEQGIPGIKVIISDSHGQEHTVTTDENGEYSVRLPAGVAIIFVESTSIPSGVILDTSSEIEIIPGSNLPCLDPPTNPPSFEPFSRSPPSGLLEFRIYLDSNNNGKHDENEQGVPDVNIYVTDSASDEYTFTTNEDVRTYQGVSVGLATISIGGDSLPEGYSLSYGELTKEVYVSENGIAAVEYGFVGSTVFSGSASLLGHILSDSVNDCINGHENTIEGVVVVIMDSQNDVHTVTTDENGKYSIQLPYGTATTYIVESTIPPGYVRSGGDDTRLVNIPLVGIVSDLACFRPVGIIEGVVWYDLDRDKNIDEGEPGIEGVEIVITDTHDDTYTATTDNNGHYSQTVNAGSATVGIVDSTLPQGYTRTALEDIIVVVVSQGTVVSNLYGFIPSRLLSAYISIGSGDGECIEDSDEGGIVGVEVVITDNHGLQHTMTTDENGAFHLWYYAGI